MKTFNRLLVLALLCMPLLSLAYTNLRVNDPRDGGVWAVGVIEEASVTIEPNGNYLAYELFLSLSPGDVGEQAKAGDSLEIVCDFELPAGSFIKGADLLIEGVWTEAALMPRSEAHAIYEGVVERRRDPLIIYKNYGDRYQFKIFPIEVGSTREMKLRYSMPMVNNDGKKGIELPWELINASAKPVDLEVNLKESDDFTAPSISAPETDFVSNGDGTSSATISGELSSVFPELSSDIVAGNVMFDYSRNDDGICYRFSFVPEKLFKLEESKKYLIMIDNDPQVIKDTSWRYIYNEEIGVSDREVREVYDIRPMPNDLLLDQVKLMLGNLPDGHTFNIVLKNDGVYTYSDTWVECTSENINSAISDLKGQTSAYSTDLKELIKQSAPFINEDDVVPLLISNSKQVHPYNSTLSRELAEEIVSEVELNKPIDGFDISSVRFDDEYNRYYYNYTLSRLIEYYAKPDYRYARRIYNLDNFVTYYTAIRTASLAKTLMISVQSMSNTGIVYDKSITNPASGLPYEPYTEMGKITEGTEFVATIAMKYRGQQLTERLTFPVGDNNNQMVEDAWAVKTVDALNNTRDEYARKEAEELSENLHILTRNTALLSIDPDAEVTPCYDCPDWGQWGGPIFWDDVFLVNDAMMFDMAMPEMAVMETTDMMVEPADVVVPEGNESLYADGYRAGIAEAEDKCISNSGDLYAEAYADGYNAGVAESSETSVVDAEPTMFTVSPNPFSDYVKIEVDAEVSATVTITDANGTVVLTESFEGSIEITDANKQFLLLPAGVYTVVVAVDGEEYTQMIVKK